MSRPQPSHRKRLRSLSVALALVAATLFSLGLLCSCSQASPSDEGDATALKGTVSTALVAYADDGRFLFIDQDTQTPYIPTNLGDAVLNSGGNPMEPSELKAGNVVRVTGDGIMLESYLGQYPNIFEVEVLEKGDPTDAERYAQLVSEIFAPADPAEIPSGSLAYATDLAQVSVMLEPVTWEWSYPTTNGNVAGVTTSDNSQLPWSTDGRLVFDISDVRISQRGTASASFSAEPESVSVERMPLIMGDAAANAGSEAPFIAGDEQAREDVASEAGPDGSVAFPIEPSFLYVLKASFANGEVEYAFYTIL